MGSPGMIFFHDARFTCAQSYRHAEGHQLRKADRGKSGAGDTEGVSFFDQGCRCNISHGDGTLDKDAAAWEGRFLVSSLIFGGIAGIWGWKRCK